MSDETPVASAPKLTRAERVAAKELALRDERERVIREGYSYDQRAMSGLVAATHQAYAGGGFHNEAVLAVLAEEDAERAAAEQSGSGEQSAPVAP